MINSLTVIGNMAADPEERKGERRTFGKGRIGVFQPGKDREGNPKPTIWLDLTAWGQWEIRDLMKCRKGDKVTVSGRLEMREWTTDDGQIRQSLSVSLTGIEKHERDGARQPHQSDPHPAGDVLPF